MFPSHVVSRSESASTGQLRRRERGAVLVHVAVAMMGLLAFSALSIDLGTLWVARAQAQNAADAAALAGSVSLAYVDPSDVDAARASAQAIVQQHQIWGQAIQPSAVTMVTGSCPSGSPSTPGECLGVTVFRGSSYGTPLPVFFSRLFGMGSTDLWASATAKVLPGNTSSCVRPIAIMDSWQPGSGPWSFDERFAPPDIYQVTGHTSTLLNVSRPLGRGEVQVPEPPAGNHYFNLDLPRVGSPMYGGDYHQRYLDNWASCNGINIEIGQEVGYWDAGHEETTISAQNLIGTDPGAYWDGTAIRGSAFQVSPRLLTIALVDPQFYIDQQPVPLADRRYVVRNLVGFFLEEAYSPAPGLEFPLRGVFVRVPGAFSASADTVAAESSFLTNVALVR
jgi:Flp pilus assembly protein TadG